VGMTCTGTSVCAAGSHCIQSHTDPNMGQCLADGAQGNLCRTMDPRCDTGLTCSSTDPTMQGICQAVAADGAACDPSGRESVCMMTSTCIPSATDPTMGVCAPNGSAGAPCRMADPRCDTGLACSSTDPATAGVCRAMVGMDAACDPTGATNVCTAPQVCSARSATTGQCTTPTAETEPNDTPAAANMVTLPATVSGAINPATDNDCFHFTLAAQASLRIEVNNGQGGCPAMADSVLNLFNGTGTMLGTNDDIGNGNTCSRIDGTGPDTFAHNLAAGDYTVCVQSCNMAGLCTAAVISTYDLDIAATP
jgi:hypothetical protein